MKTSETIDQMRPLYPNRYPECPMGFGCNESSGLWDSDIQCYEPLKTWRSCDNALYCHALTTAWDLPLKRELNCNSNYVTWEVLFTHVPHNLGFRFYYRYMKKYGYAEARNLPTVKNEILDATQVIANYFKYGYAIAVPVKISPELHPYYKRRCKQDKHGIWWITWGNPPKHSDERWERLAKK